MNHSRGGLMAPISRKRKERSDFFMQHPAHHTNSNSNSNNSRGKLVQPHPFHTQTTTTSLKQKAPGDPASSNRLLAGYLAHEFLTQGTLLGQRFDPARAEAVPVSTPTADLKKKKAGAAPDQSRLNGGSSAEPSSASGQQKKAYAEVSRLVRTEGAHIPGIVNPTQLARWIQK